MQCQVRSMCEAASSGGEPDEPIPQGKVGKVCREWLVREDGVMAYKLQHEEIEQHYDHNRFRNRVVRTDLVEAKTLQQTEAEEAEMVRQAYERMLLEQEQNDEAVAMRLQNQLLQEETRKKRSTEEEDQRLALQLQEKERQRLEKKKKDRELDREKRQVENAHAIRFSTTQELVANGGAVAQEPPRDKRPDDIDLTDFLLEPPPGLTQVELKKFLEDQDEELARLLQEQEAKRQGPSDRDRQVAIEAQDRELARVLQEQERARLKRARERARQRSLAMQQQDMVGEDSGAIYERIDETALPYDKDQRLRQREMDPSRSMDGFDVDVPYTDSGSGGRGNRSMPNVAMILDPTYSIRGKNGSLKESPSYLERGYDSQPPPPPPLHPRGMHSVGSGTSSSVENSNTPSPMKSPSHSYGSSPLMDTLRSEYLETLQDSEDDPVPPYMPIQGQRREEKMKKNKKGRDGCKSQ